MKSWIKYFVITIFYINGIIIAKRITLNIDRYFPLIIDICYVTWIRLNLHDVLHPKSWQQLVITCHFKYTNLIPTYSRENCFWWVERFMKVSVHVVEIMLWNMALQFWFFFLMLIQHRHLDKTMTELIDLLLH